MDEDIHLCIRCGRVVEGMSNYITHRQHLCYKFDQPLNSVFLPAPPEEPPIPELPTVADDIYKLSANDFFLSLNLQSIQKNSVGDGSEISKSSASDILCSELDIPSIDLENPFSQDKSCSKVSNENDCLDLSHVIFPGEKWEDLPISDPCGMNTESNKKGQSPQSENSCSPTEDTYQLTEPKSRLQTSTKSKRLKKKGLKEYAFTNFSTLNVPRTSYRQKLHANDSMICCQRKPTAYTCVFCTLKFAFASTYVDHVLLCKDTVECDANKWETEVMRNDRLFISSSQFKCVMCSFYCNESFMFLSHLKSADHRQNAARLKKPLMCILCRDECSSSDEMNEHFSRCHLRYSKDEHPVIIAEKKKNLHCCYCFTLIRTTPLIEEKERAGTLLKEDKMYIKQGAVNVSSCSYGVEKQLLNSFMSKIGNWINASSNDLSKDGISVQKSPNHDVAEPVISPFAQSSSSQNCEKDSPTESSSVMVQEESVPLEKRIVARITTKDGKLTYKKLKLSSKNWTCPTCSLKFFTELALESHSKECSSESQNCSIRMKITLRKRNKTNGVSSFLCDKCTYVGKSFHHLTRHFRSHSGEKPFKCPHCSCTFSLSSQLVRHKRLHTGQKPYKCPYCSYACNSHENLRKHILKTKKHEGKRMYPCDNCDYETNEFSSYKSHLHDVHSVELPNGLTQPPPLNSNCDEIVAV